MKDSYCNYVYITTRLMSSNSNGTSSSYWSKVEDEIMDLRPTECMCKFPTKKKNLMLLQDIISFSFTFALILCCGWWRMSKLHSIAKFHIFIIFIFRVC